MYEVFEFVRLCSVSQINRSTKNRNNGTVIKQFAWREEEENSFLALLCSNDNILLRYDVSGHVPVMKQLPWLQGVSIGAMFFDPTLSWLLIMTETTQEIFIIPALSVINSKAAVDQIFQTNDVTYLQFKIINGNVTCGLWWQTLESRQIAVIATKVGEIIFVDLLKMTAVTKVTIDVTITDISLSQDDLLSNTTLLITTITGNQWKLLLEKKSTAPSFSPDSELGELGYDTIDNSSMPPLTILDEAEEKHVMFSPVKYTHFQPPTFLQPQFARGRHFITAHSTTSSTLKVLDSGVDNIPLFVYKLPPDTKKAILTDKLIFSVAHQDLCKKVMILSSQKSENSLDDNQLFNSQAVIQEFILTEEENLLGVERKRYPFYYHEHRENEWCRKKATGNPVQPMKNKAVYLDSTVLNLPITTHTVLDGCVIITNHSVYEIRPCISPERLFLHLAMSLPDTTTAENLAISIGLDLTSLSELAAETMLQQSCFGKAMKLYTLSKCPAAKRTGGLARHGCISETLVLLRQFLSNPNFELNTSERKFLSNMLLHCFVYQLHCPGQSLSNIQSGFRDFLLGSFSFVEQTAVNLLAEFGKVELLLSLAKARGLVIDALTSLVKFEAFSSIPFSALSDLVQRGFCAHLMQSGCLLPYLSPEDLLRLVTIRPQLAIQSFNLLRPLIPLLKHNHLIELARIFDPSKSVMRGMLVRLKTKRRRTNSLTSVVSLTSDTMDIDSHDLQADILVEFFLFVVLHLNQQRNQIFSDNKSATPILSILTQSPADQLYDMEKEQSSTENGKKLSVQTQPIACGPKHSAIIRNCDLYVCGKSHMGRLGIGDTPQSMCPPTRVENLHTLQLRVEAVACGSEHTLALTQQGVYGWGNCKYGQVGVGTCFSYKRPMLLETLQSDTIVAIDCGQYHSLALTADHQVYTWGWGVHGQLGHGNPEDCLIPTHVAYLLNLAVVRIAGGYAHSLALTESGDVWSFGCGYFGQLGLGMSNKTTIPQKVAIPSPVSVIGTKYFHNVAVTITNKVFTWGLHPQNFRQIAASIRSARLAGSNLQDQNTFMFPNVVDTTYVHGKIIKVCCGSLHSVLLTDDGGVYLWGRNLEGQLGTGSRQDERIPKMVTSINDQHIVAIASGGEFTLAFNVDGCIWAWGKNDSGQLGHLKTRKENQSSNSYRRSTSVPNEVNMPAIMRGLPISDNSNPYWSTMLSLLTQDVLWTYPPETGNESTWDNLPSLDKLGLDTYDCSVVPVTLKVLDNICDPWVILQHCVDLKEWLTAGHISCLTGDFVQALYYRLNFVMSIKHQLEYTDVVTLCTGLVQYHINLVCEKKLSHTALTALLNQISLYAISFWQKENFPMTHLEEIFNEYLTSLAPCLLEVILRSTVYNLKDVYFSINFSLKVFKVYMSSNVRSMDWKSQNKDQLMTLVDKHIHSLLQPSVHLQPRDKLTPKEHLWAGILRNMRKETGVITLTHTQLDHLENNGNLEKDSKSDCKVFTCGHHSTGEKFKVDGVDWLTCEMTSSQLRLPNSASLLKYIFSQEKIIPSACPKCVLYGLEVK